MSHSWGDVTGSLTACHIAWLAMGMRLTPAVRLQPGDTIRHDGRKILLSGVTQSATGGFDLAGTMPVSGTPVTVHVGPTDRVERY